MCGSANVVRYQSAILLRRRKVSSRKFRRTFCSSATYCATPEPHNESQQAAGIFLHLLTATTPSHPFWTTPNYQRSWHLGKMCTTVSGSQRRTTSHLLEHVSRTACYHSAVRPSRLKLPPFSSRCLISRFILALPAPHIIHGESSLPDP